MSYVYAITQVSRSDWWVHNLEDLVSIEKSFVAGKEQRFSVRDLLSSCTTVPKPKISQGSP